LTVTVWLDAADRTIARPAVVTLSEPLEAAVLNCTVGVGAVSLSVMVYVDVVFTPSVAFAGADSVTTIVSLGSTRVSSTIATLIDLLVSPGLKVNVPLVVT